MFERREIPEHRFFLFSVLSSSKHFAIKSVHVEHSQYIVARVINTEQEYRTLPVVGVKNSPSTLIHEDSLDKNQSL